MSRSTRLTHRPDRFAPSAGMPPAVVLRLALLLIAGCACLIGPAAAQGGDSSLPLVAHAERDSGPVTPSLHSGKAPSAAKGLSATSAYTLTWWTADGGGASYRTAGSYTLGGTAGQPDAAALRSTGSYTLTSGFWLPSCLAAPVTPAIARAGSTVSLSWTHNAANQTYQVHRDTTPYFAPVDATRRAIVSAAPWRYADPDAVIGNPDVNYYYLLRATCGAAYANGGRAGEFDFRLTPGAP